MRGTKIESPAKSAVEWTTSIYVWVTFTKSESYIDGRCWNYHNVILATWATCPDGSLSKLIYHSVNKTSLTWWRHQMETFSALLVICAGNSPVPGEFPTHRPVTQSFDVYFDLRPNKRLSKQSWGWWFETPSRPLWRHHNVWVPVRSVVTKISKALFLGLYHVKYAV